MLEFHKLLRTSLGTRVRTVLAHVVGFGMTGDDANAEQSEDVEVVHPVGFVARPVPDADTEAVIYRDGDEVIVLFFVHKSSTVHTVEEGAAELYSPKEPTCVVKMRASGKIEITAKSGQDIVLNGGSAKVGRVGDAVAVASTMSTWISAVTSYVNGIAPGTLVLPTNFGTINAGADHILG